MNLPASSRAVECVILFADLAGSTQLYERLGNREAFARVDRCLKAMQKVVANNGGRVVKLTGDGLLAVFADAGPVIDTTIAMTFEIGELPSSGESPIDIRIGFHFGPVLESEADVFGETVNIAARLCELASPGRALTTSETAARLSRGKQRMLRQLPPRPLKGINRPFELWELVCDDLGKVTAVFEGFDLTLATLNCISPSATATGFSAMPRPACRSAATRLPTSCSGTNCRRDATATSRSVPGSSR